MERVFLKNCLPCTFFEHIVKDFLLHKLNNPKAASESNYKNIIFKLTYEGKTSLISKIKSPKKSQNINVNIVFTAYKVAKYFFLKDKIDSLLRSSLIYIIFKCLVNLNLLYIGKT